MNCIIYTRYSPRPDAADSHSCEWQRAECEQFAYKKKWNIVATLDDPDRSGADCYREVLWSAIKRLKKGETLLVWKWDRLARDLMLSLQIERAVQKRGATVTAVEGDIPGNAPQAVAMRQIMMAIAELERKMISERTSAAMRAHQRAGRRMSARIPYGYMADPKDEHRVVENPDEIPTLNEIWERHKKGESNNAIAHALDPAKSRCGKWHTGVVRRIVMRLKANEI